jgi:hypothetical protein
MASGEVPATPPKPLLRGWLQAAPVIGAAAE